MSSLKSRRVPAPAEHVEPILAAVLDVAENTFFAFVEPCDATAFAALVDGGPMGDGSSQDWAPWVSIEVAFHGAYAGFLSAVLPRRLAGELVSSFVGEPEDALSEGQVMDGSAEFGNMVCGSWLTREAGRRRFDLQPPAVTTHPAPWRPDTHAGELPWQIHLSLNGQPVALRLDLVEE